MWSASLLARDLEALQDKMPPFPQAEAERTVASRAGPAAGRPVRVVRPAGRRRLDRAGAPRRSRHRRRRPRRRGEGAAAGGRAALQGRSRRVLLCRAQRREDVGGGAAAAAHRGGRDAAPLGRDRDGSAVRGGGALGDGGEHQGRSRFPRADGGLGPHRARRAHARMDRRDAAVRPRRCSKPRASISSASRAR